jgi:DnaJ-class molecular chaperone
MKDLYKILALHRNASADEIKTAYRKLAKQWHPDVNDLPDAEQKFLAIQEAYEILTDTYKKATYDILLHKKSKSTTRQKTNNKATTQQAKPKAKQRSDFEIWIDQQRQVIYQDYYKQRAETEQLWKFEIKIDTKNYWQIYSFILIGLWLVSLISISTYGLYLLPTLSLISFLIGCKKA